LALLDPALSLVHSHCSLLIAAAAHPAYTTALVTAAAAADRRSCITPLPRCHRYSRFRAWVGSVRTMCRPH